MLNAETLANECDETARRRLAKSDQFYGQSAGMALGTGVIVEDLVLPIYLPNENAYATGKGAALILTHECDIEPTNIRPFNQNAIVAPLIPLASYIKTSPQTDQESRVFALHVANGNMTRVTYLPRLGGNSSPLFVGAFVDFNFITSCGVTALTQSRIICSLTGYAISVIDNALKNHLFRPKADHAPLPH
jgi:hypothetical protein